VEHVPGTVSYLYQYSDTSWIGLNYFVNLKVLIDLAILYISALYSNHRADNNPLVVNTGCGTYI
jgi:hypothetical protein